MHLNGNHRRGGGRLLNSDAQHAAQCGKELGLQSHRRQFDLVSPCSRVCGDHGQDHTAGLDGDGEDAHVGKKHCSFWRKLAVMESAFASYSSMVPPAFSTRVTSLAETSSMVAPGGNGGGGGDSSGGGGEAGGGGDGEGAVEAREEVRAAAATARAAAAEAAAAGASRQPQRSRRWWRCTRRQWSVRRREACPRRR